MEALGHILGTHWDEETLRRLHQSGGDDSAKTVFVPLSIAVNPDLLKTLKEMSKSAKRKTMRDVPPPPVSDLKIKTLKDYEPSKLTDFAAKTMRGLGISR